MSLANRLCAIDYVSKFCVNEHIIILITSLIYLSTRRQSSDLYKYLFHKQTFLF
jgi:hypothetical protein